jgi:hypothetical protein
MVTQSISNFCHQEATAAASNQAGTDLYWFLLPGAQLMHNFNMTWFKQLCMNVVDTHVLSPATCITAIGFLAHRTIVGHGRDPTASHDIYSLMVIRKDLCLLARELQTILAEWQT